MTPRSGGPAGRSSRPRPRPTGPKADAEPAAAPPPARQASLRRLRQFAVRPNRELGQNFLVDDNLLGVIGRLAELGEDDVVLEVGGGLGVLSEYLAARVAHLHVVEVDSSLEPPLREALAPFDGASLHMANAVELPLAGLRPRPDKVVANLPYGVAATVLLKSIEELPGARRWVAMVQREVGQRLAATPGTRAYGAPSAIAQLACDVRVERRVPAAVFHPVPRVESVLCVLRRHSPPPDAEVAALVHAAFMHRRKTLAGSLALAAPGDDAGGGADLKAAARAALREMSLPEDARAERLSPSEFASLTERIGAARVGELLARRDAGA